MCAELLRDLIIGQMQVMREITELHGGATGRVGAPPPRPRDPLEGTDGAGAWVLSVG